MEDKRSRADDEDAPAGEPQSKKTAVVNPALNARIVAAIRALANHKGSSAAAIKKALAADGEVDAADVKNACKFLVGDGTLKQGTCVVRALGGGAGGLAPRRENAGRQKKKAPELTCRGPAVKQSFLVAADPVPEDKTPKISMTTSGSGHGTPAADGDTIRIRYKGALASGTVFDEGVLNMVVNGGEVIRGLDQGVVGIRAGETRVITIPPSLAYGKRGSGKDVPPDSTVVFTVTITDEEVPAAQDDDEVEDEGDFDGDAEGGKSDNE